MLICKNCLSIMRPLQTFMGFGSGWLQSEDSYILCCDRPAPIEVEDGELENYETNWQILDLEDLTEKEETILNYLTKEGRIGFKNPEVHTSESADSMVRSKQLWFDFL